MINITLVRGNKHSKQVHLISDNLAIQYTKRGFNTTILNDGLVFLFIKLFFFNSDVIDFHDSFSSLIIPLIKLLKRKVTVVFSLHERAEFEPKNNFVKRSFIRLGTYFAISYADQVVTSQKSLQYFIYRRFGLLPKYIPEGVDMTIPSRKRKYASHFLFIGEQKDCSKVLRAFKTNRRIKIIKMEEELPSLDTIINSQKIDAILILKRLYNPGVVRKIAVFGLPIISIEADEHKEVLRQNTIFIHGTSPKYVKEAINNLRTKYPQYSREGTRERKFINNLFNWEHIAKEYIRTYRHSHITEVHLDSLVKKEALG